MRICLACGSAISVDKGPCPVCGSPGSPPSEPLQPIGYAGYAPQVAPVGPVTEAVASVARPEPTGGLLAGNRKLLAGLAVLAVVLAGAIIKIGWFSSNGASTSAAGPTDPVVPGPLPGGSTVGATTGPTSARSTRAASSPASKPGGSTPAASTASGATPSAPGSSPSATTDGPTNLVVADPAVFTTAVPDVTLALVRTLTVYAGGINAKDLTSAYSAYSPQQQLRSPFAKWSKGVQNSQLSAMHIVSAAGAVTTLATGPVTIDVTFVSHQPGAQGPVAGQTCTRWALQYTMAPKPDASGYLIDSARPSSGTGYAAC